MTFTDFVFLLEMIGTVAFSVSGVIVAKEKHMDVFGAVILGCVTSVGGGCIRDLLLGITPPAMFTNSIYVTAAAIVSLSTFTVEYLRSKRTTKKEPAPILQSKKKTTSAQDKVMNIADTLGLAIFVVVGCRTAFEQSLGHNLFLCVFVGVTTGIGGGILRDVLAGQMPFVFRRHVYGIAAILGAIAFCVPFSREISLYLSAFISIFVTCMIRYLAIHYHWNLPSFH